MNSKENEPLINDEEFQLLAQITGGGDGLQVPQKDTTFDVSSRTEEDGLLMQLGGADALKLVADYGNHRLVFPVQVNMGDFNNFGVTLAAPKIFEKGSSLRAWRLLNDKCLCLVDKKGQQLNYQIKDLSTSGISLLMQGQNEVDFPLQLNDICLQLPNHTRLPISATQARRIDGNTVAYSLTGSTDAQVLAELAQYLFTCHAELHPDAYPAEQKMRFI